MPFGCSAEIFVDENGKLKCDYNYINFNHNNNFKYYKNDSYQTESFILESFKNIDLEKVVFY